MCQTALGVAGDRRGAMGRRRIFPQAIAESGDQIEIGIDLVDAAYGRIDGALAGDYVPPVPDPAPAIDHQYPVKLGTHQYLVLGIYLQCGSASISFVVDMCEMLGGSPVSEPGQRNLVEVSGCGYQQIPVKLHYLLDMVLY